MEANEVINISNPVISFCMSFLTINTSVVL